MTELVPSPLDPKAIGTSLPRVDGVEKVTGRAAYAVEHPVDRPLSAWLVQSTVARGRVVSIDRSEALAPPGVVSVLDHTDAPRLAQTDNAELAILQDDAIGFRGQIVAVVLAETSEAAREGARLDSVADVFAGAGWHEREAAELFGITFIGGDLRRLLLPDDYVGAPLRKDAVLAARAGVEWPGVKEPGGGGSSSSKGAPSRRRMVPPGVPEPEIWGDRDPTLPPADPADVAASAVGGRVRRRKR